MFELVMRVYQEPGITINSSVWRSEVPKKAGRRKTRGRELPLRGSRRDTGTVCWRCGARNFL